MAVVEALLSSLFDTVLDKLILTPLLEKARLLKLDTTTLSDCTDKLSEIKSVLHHAEQRQIRDDDDGKNISTWLDDLTSLASDIEDVLDDIETEPLRRSLEQGPRTSSSKVSNFIPSFHRPKFNRKINKKMRAINAGLDAIVKRKKAFGLRSDGEEGSAVPPSVHVDRQTTSLVTEAEVYGREEDREKIIELLLSDEVASALQVKVIPIVGMGGIGKTTLAQIIYNDKRVKDNFQVRGWACVSDQFHLETVTKQILESLQYSSSSSQSSLQLLQIGSSQSSLQLLQIGSSQSSLQSLQTKLQEKLKEKRFFLVLDDVWIESLGFHEWSKLQAPLKGATGSVIIVTTRSESVASSIRHTTALQSLRALQEADTWSLFECIAFENTTSDARKNLEPIGRRIIGKCNGVPLAVMTLASLLRSKQDEKSWEEMLSNEILDLPIQESKILPILRLSYYYLPSALKQCFAYCSIFPTDRKFRKDELILLWAAQGFLNGGALNAGKTIIDVGETYFDELLSRSFFQQSGGGKASSFVMHDLIHDLARFVSRNFCSTLDLQGQVNISERTRHVSYITDYLDVSKRFDPLLKSNKLRTFLQVDVHNLYRFNYLGDKFLHEQLPRFECLRALSLSGYQMTDLPDSFGNLGHLRYLNLSSTTIKKLPQSICMILNLQSLVLSCCGELTELPSKIGNLINLIHLDVSETKIERIPVEIGNLINLIHLDVSETKIERIPVEIGKLVKLHHLDVSRTRLEGMPIGTFNKLRDLRRLPAFVIGKLSGGASIAELRDLSHLEGELSITNLQNVENARDALDANLKEKKGLEYLELACDTKDMIENASTAYLGTQVLESLQPHTNLKRLKIKNYNGAEFPKWLGDPAFSSLVFLVLEGCGSCSSLPPVGQLGSLKDLRIVRMNKVEKVGGEFYGSSSDTTAKPFGSLEILRFEEMLNWEEWVCYGVEFSRLKELYIRNCPKLKGDIPKCLPQSTKLVINGCLQLSCCLPMAPSIRELVLRECVNDVVVGSVGGLTSLASLSMQRISKMPFDQLGRMRSLVTLSVYDCPELKEIPPIFHELISLQRFEIKRCGSLLSLSEMALPPMLEYLTIEECPKLECLPAKKDQGMMQNNDTWSLRELRIYSCGSLRCLPRGIINSLKTLSISRCEKMELAALGEEEDMIMTTHSSNNNHCYASLTDLYIMDCCPSLTSFPLASFTKLENLTISRCRNLESLDVPPDGLLLTSLRSLGIHTCPKFVSLNPDQRGLATPNLREFQIRGCNKLKSLPPQGMRTLFTSLQVLDIMSCSEIDEATPDHRIWNCNKLVKSRTSGRMEMEGLLGILDVGLHHLTSLRISFFPNLESLDTEAFQHLTSLQTLELCYCPKLKYLPKKGLPSSLSHLEITGCPPLQKRCKRDKGKEWPKISHIPCILFFEENVILS